MFARHIRWMTMAGLLVAGLTLIALPGPVLAKEPAPKEGWFGVYLQDLDSDLAEGLDYKGNGVLVRDVVDGSPADKAGLEKGDVIVSLGAKIVNSPEELTTIVKGMKPGQTVPLRVWRDGQARDMKITVGERSADAEWAPKADTSPRVERRVVRVAPAPGAPHMMWLDGEGGGPNHMVMRLDGRPRLGVQLQDLNQDLAEALGTNARGALVTEVVDDTPADRAGLKAGDVITRVDGKDVEDAAALRSALRDAEGETSITVVRRGQTRTVSADLGRKPESRSWTWSGQGVDPDKLKLDIEKSLKGLDGLDEDVKRQLDDLKDEIRELRKQVEGMKGSR